MLNTAVSKSFSWISTGSGSVFSGSCLVHSSQSHKVENHSQARGISVWVFPVGLPSESNSGFVTTSLEAESAKSLSISFFTSGSLKTSSQGKFGLFGASATI